MTAANANDPAVPYAASCNPPRRAKRARTDSVDAAPRGASRRPRPLILPKDHSPAPVSPAADAADSDSPDEEDYDPAVRAPAARRRGRKAGVLSRSARESLRKLNHSRIEKARRTKINETLATLSALVNAREGVAPELAPVPSEAAAKGKPEEKEFKLDVLVKTVTYMQDLIDKVRALEARGCPTCARSRPASASPGPRLKLKRKRSPDDGDADVQPVLAAPAVGEDKDEDCGEDEGEDTTYAGDDDEKGADSDIDTAPSSAPAPAAATSASESPRLPPIASWLPHPYVDPSCLASLSGPQHAQPGTGSSTQLPSPPPSGRFRASSTAGSMTVPTLTLPGPAHPFTAAAATTITPATLPSTSSSQFQSPCSPSSSFTERARRASFSPHSPTWTPEDESAASLLLQMSSSPGSASVSSSGAPKSNSSVSPLLSSASVGSAPRVLHHLKAADAGAAARFPHVERPSKHPQQQQRQQRTHAAAHAETPSSLLGLGKDG